jgi:hypothetical protein
MFLVPSVAIFRKVSFFEVYITKKTKPMYNYNILILKMWFTTCVTVRPAVTTPPLCLDDDTTYIAHKHFLRYYI